MIIVPPICQREILSFPDNIREDLADALAQLDAGLSLSMPLSRPMSIIGTGVHELRLKDRVGSYRVFYVLPGRGVVYVLHAFKKKTRATPKPTIELVRKRLKESSL